MADYHIDSLPMTKRNAVEELSQDKVYPRLFGAWPGIFMRPCTISYIHQFYGGAFNMVNIWICLYAGAVKLFDTIFAFS